MSFNKVLTAASGLVLASFLASQLPYDPVPTRIETEIYGGYTTAAALEIDCYLRGPDYSMIRVRGGEPGAIAQILVAPKPAWIRLPFGDTLLVSTDAVPFSGFFDGGGAFHMKLDLAEKDFCGYSVYFQGVQVRPSYDGCELTPGLKVTFHEGNLQPDLNYEGPPVVSILCKASENRLPPEFGVLFRADVPGEGYALVTDKIEVSDHGVTLVFLSLTQTGALPEKMPPMPPLDGVRLRHFVDLGEFVAPNIEVLISPKSVVDRPKDYARGAWIHTVLPPSDLQEFIDASFVDRPRVSDVSDRVEPKVSDVSDREVTDKAEVPPAKVTDLEPVVSNRLPR